MNIKVTLDADGLERKLHQAARKQLRSVIERRVGALRCPNHQRQPNVFVQESPAGPFRFEISGCCEEIITEVKKEFT